MTAPPQTPDRLFSLNGTTAIVTGASSGIGRHLASTYAAAGATVYAGARRLDRLNELAKQAPEGRIIAHELDVTSDASVQELITRIETDQRVATVALNAAGIFSYTPPPMSDTEFNTILDVNITGTWRMFVACGEHLKRAGQGGSLIAIGSSNTTFTVAPNNHAYFASKGGVENLVRWLAADLAGAGIRVNGIAPGWIETDIMKTAMANQEKRGIVLDRTPLSRIGSPEDLEGAALYLASEAAAWVTGTTMVVDGGLALNRLWNLP